MSLPPPQDALKIDIEQLRARLVPRDVTVTASETSALERLIDIAKRDTGQSRYVADFLLAWWNAGTCGGFDLTNLWAVDTAISDDMATVFAMIAKTSKYPDSLGYETDFRAIVRAWRPELQD